MKPSEIPDHVLKLMSKSARKEMKLQTSEEAQAAFCARSEKELQKQIAGLLTQRGIWFDTDAMSKRRTGTRGSPDFLFSLRGAATAFEAKFGNGKLSADQATAHARMRNNGWRVHVIHSLNEARDILNQSPS